MSPLARLVLRARRVLRAAVPPALAATSCGLVVVQASSPLPTPVTGSAAVLYALLFARALFSRRDKPSSLLHIEIGLYLIALAHALALAVEGSLDGRFHALVFVAIGVVGAFAKPGAAVVVALASVLLEALVRRAQPLSVAAAPLGLHLGLGLLFALLHALVLRSEVSRIESTARAFVREETERLREAARSYRLLGGEGATPGPRQEEHLARSGVEEIHESVLLALRLLRQALGLHTAMLLWRNDQGTHLRISELDTAADDVSEGPFLVTEGLFRAVMDQEKGVSVVGLKSSQRLPYYQGSTRVRAVCAWPVVEGGTIRGVLVVDRTDDRAFTELEQELLAEASRFAVRTIHNERVFVQLERARAEQGKLYRAAEALGRASAESDVIHAGVQSAREVTSVDFAAVTLFEERSGLHEIRAVSGEDSGSLAGKTFKGGNSLVSMALESRHPLPYRGDYDQKRQTVFSKRLAPPPMPSILVLPMLVHDRPLGALVLGSRRRHAFPEAVRATLEVLASHVAVSLSNARMLRRLEELATTDGLTGLLNKRALLEVAEQKLRSAVRFQRRVSVLVTDIDHFKKVNDTYGHDVGDVVIKGLGDILRRAKRNTDSVARFGGEEFVLVCEETDARGAMLLAERVREELGRTTFHTPSGQELSVTCSLGVATFPEAGTSWDELFKAADEALYVSKRSGRDRSTAWSPSMRAAAQAGQKPAA
jgi:two-component system cell cycle response regulator